MVFAWRLGKLLCPMILTAGGALFGQEKETLELRRRVLDLETKVQMLERAVELLTKHSTPAPPPPAAQIEEAPAETARGFSMPPELVPEIGKIGAQVGVLLSGSANPFGLNNGSFAAGFIDLPLVDARWMRGKLAYEISVGMSQSNTTLQTTSNVAQVANLAVLTALNPTGGLGNVGSAVAGTGAAPFPVTTSGVTRLRLLQVVPFSLKYTSTAFDRWRLRPYALFGFGTYVTIHHQNPARGNPPSFGIRKDANLTPEIFSAVDQIFGGKAPFGGPLVAGQISQSPELQARGLPGGHGNIDFGILGGFGFEYRVTPSLSLGFDNRYNRIAGAPGLLTTFGTRIGVHF